LSSRDRIACSEHRQNDVGDRARHGYAKNRGFALRDFTPSANRGFWLTSVYDGQQDV
jgi:hypothetical protein